MPRDPQDPRASHLLFYHCQGGSYGRETVLKGDSDGTLVIFVSNLGTFKDQKKIQHEILCKIYNWLKHCQLERKLAAKMEILTSSRGLFIQLSTRWQSITFKVLPAFNALGEPSCVCVGEQGSGGVC